MALRILEKPSPNFDDRPAVASGSAVRHLVLHYTGMTTGDAAVERLCDPAARVSAHYLLHEDGAVIRMVAEDKRAWHAGKSFWGGLRDINYSSVGIEIVNPGHDHGYRPFPEAQITALLELAGGIIARHGITSDNVVGHSDIAPSRKIDPGELFPWQRLAEAGIGLWPAPPRPLPGVPDLVAAFQRLSAIGYPVPLNDELGADILAPASATADVITAFQRRFRPRRVDGVLDLDTAAVLAAVDLRYAEFRG